MQRNTPLAIVAFVTILLAAVVQICKPMQMYCGPSCAAAPMASAVSSMGDGMTDAMPGECSERTVSCAASGDIGHMALFSEAFPSQFAGTVTLLPLFVALALLSLLKRSSEKSPQPLKARLASLVRRRANVARIDPMAFALRRGILQPILYA